jgi:hypothetical protein
MAYLILINFVINPSFPNIILQNNPLLREQKISNVLHGEIRTILHSEESQALFETSLFKRDGNALHCKVNVSSRYQKMVLRG